MAKFTIEDHEAKMRELLNAPAQQEGQKPAVLRSLLAKAKSKRKRPVV